MNTDTLLQLVHRSFQVTLGATSSLVEVLQDPQKRTENLTKLQAEFSQVTEEWAEKGAVTEQEARNFVNTLMNRPRSPSDSVESPMSRPSPSAESVTEPDTQVELQELTAQIAALREELERMREQGTTP